MRNLPKKIELLANIGIIVVAILLGVVLVSRYLLPAPKADAGGDMRVRPGMKLSVSGVDWTRADQTLLLVLSTNCRYCTESVPFYQRLAQQKAGRSDLRLVAVLPQVTSEAQKYLDEQGVTVDEIAQVPPASVSAKATPTLIMVDRTGSVIESWVGKLTPEKETEVSKRFLTERAGNQ